MREPRLGLVLLTFLVMLSMALVAFLLARMPQKISEKFDSTHRDSPLDGLRGVLATFVFAHHFYLMHRWSLQGEWAVADNFGLHWMYFAQNLGAIPVSLFFMITGFLFLNKLKQKEINWKNLYIARIRRIMPFLLLATAFLFPPYTPLNRILVALLFVMLAGGYDFGGILRHRGMKMLGDMSYSIYLMHGVVLYGVFVLGGWFDFQAHGLLVYTATFPIIFVLVMLLSCITYFGVERPFLRRRNIGNQP